MALSEVPPIPPELAEPNPGDDAWVDDLVQRACDLADERPGWDLETALAILTAPLDDVPDDDQPSPARAWRINSLGEAEWAMRHVAVVDAEMQSLEDQAEEWAARIAGWYEQKTRALRARRAFFAGHLERYALEQRELDPRTKSITTPSGRVSTRGGGPAVIVADEDEVVRWAAAELDAAQRPDVLKTTTTVQVAGLRKVVSIVEVVDFAKIITTDGTTTTWAVEDEGVGPLPGVLDVITLPDGSEAQVAKVEVIDSHLEVQGPDGKPVPGTGIRPAAITATVQAEQP